VEDALDHHLAKERVQQVAVLMLGLHGGPTVTHEVTLYAFIGYCLLVFAGILALRVVVLVFRPGAD
jgi:ubiquinone biosynthesis protein